jgi:hypothetical protein
MTGERRETGSEEKMEELHVEGLASHDDPESCVGTRKEAGEALTGAHAGWVLSPEINSRASTVFLYPEGEMLRRENASATAALRGRRPHARVEPHCAGTGRSSGRRRNVATVGRNGKALAVIRR